MLKFLSHIYYFLLSHKLCEGNKPYDVISNLELEKTSPKLVLELFQSHIRNRGERENGYRVIDFSKFRQAKEVEDLFSVIHQFC